MRRAVLLVALAGCGRVTSVDGEVAELARGCGLAGSAWLESGVAAERLGIAEARILGDRTEKELHDACAPGAALRGCCEAGRVVRERIGRFGGSVAACQKLDEGLRHRGC